MESETKYSLIVVAVALVALVAFNFNDISVYNDLCNKKQLLLINYL